MVQSEKPFGELFGVDDNEVDALVLTEMVVYLQRCRHREREARPSRGVMVTVFDSAGAAAAWAALPRPRRRYPVAEGGDGADAVGRSTWPQHLEVPVPELTRRR